MNTARRSQHGPVVERRDGPTALDVGADPSLRLV